ncbi:unnamed protein product [Acanthosepion pharaonis]|uniref:Uncharacterized protein n=1 Tax=Acanthosepion pharaonis TaxID=158019 RepID=A0A812E1W2_ACAPH|nr:unnamed protein product [Sepia pharaonis]
MPVFSKRKYSGHVAWSKFTLIQSNQSKHNIPLHLIFYLAVSLFSLCLSPSSVTLNFIFFFFSFLLTPFSNIPLPSLSFFITFRVLLALSLFLFLSYLLGVTHSFSLFHSHSTFTYSLSLSLSLFLSYLLGVTHSFSLFHSQSLSSTFTYSLSLSLSLSFSLSFLLTRCYSLILSFSLTVALFDIYILSFTLSLSLSLLLTRCYSLILSFPHSRSLRHLHTLFHSLSLFLSFFLTRCYSLILSFFSQSLSSTFYILSFLSLSLFLSYLLGVTHSFSLFHSQSLSSTFTYSLSLSLSLSHTASTFFFFSKILIFDFPNLLFLSLNNCLLFIFPYTFKLSRHLVSMDNCHLLSLNTQNNTDTAETKPKLVPFKQMLTFQYSNGHNDFTTAIRATPVTSELF